MSDITMCKDQNCPKRENCKRFMAQSSEFWQSYFCESPRQGILCREYWPIKDFGIKFRYSAAEERILIHSIMGYAEIFPISSGHVADIRLYCEEGYNCSIDKIAPDTEGGVRELVEFCELLLT